VRGAEQEVPASLGQRTQHQPVMLLADLVTSGVEALGVLLDPAQSGLLADGPDHGMKLDDPVRVFPPGSPVGGLVDIGVPPALEPPNHITARPNAAVWTHAGATGSDRQVMTITSARGGPQSPDPVPVPGGAVCGLAATPARLRRTPP
jgi:hypothetical protein